ncbi:MAG: glycerol-3-phosphate O-acyltransferase [Myxococcota bacterium]
MPREQVERAVGGVLAAVRKLVSEERILLDSRLDGRDAAGVLEDALKYFNSYHKARPVRLVAHRVHVDDAKLLFYYHNRLDGYRLEGAVNPQ